MLIYEFDKKYRSMVRLNEMVTPILFRKHDHRYEPLVLAVKATVTQEPLSFVISEIEAMIYWDYTDGVIKRKELKKGEVTLPSELPLHPEYIKDKPDDITFYTQLETLRIALDENCVSKNIEEPYLNVLRAYSLDSYRLPELDIGTIV